MEYDQFRRFWMPFWAYLGLIGVYLLILGVALAGLVTAMRAKERDRSD